ncbi:AraC family transcriptional regulator [Saccharopolyspora hirsuta]|uniref:AraC family transcriptional regulator n=1 Tax=Saccharopolyspora hirsuta TaxID=1837 RepID=A0A5M7C7J8_SACHI|nr:helix-turn-helix domain-containing protein [Saccharopolyspora hirsuta]KAA5838296.1 AraC family transcriptional regulator [Saccharopolyspora hirsuta]
MGVPLRAWAAAVGTSPASRYWESPPPANVATAVGRRWQGCAGWDRELRILPDGCADLVWDGHELAVVRIADAPERRALPATAKPSGVRLRCGAAGSVLGTALSELPRGATRLVDLWGSRAAQAEELLAESPRSAHLPIVEALIAERLRDDNRPGAVAVRAARQLRTTSAKPADIATELGISERGLRRLLRHETGLSAKQLQRVHRFQQFLARLPALARGTASLAAVAADLSYADQSHLGRECLRLSGSSPATLVRSWARQDRLAEKFQTPRRCPGKLGEHDDRSR